MRRPRENGSTTNTKPPSTAPPKKPATTTNNKQTPTGGDLLDNILDDLQGRPQSQPQPGAPMSHASKILLKIHSRFPELKGTIFQVTTEHQTSVLKTSLKETMKVEPDEFVGCYAATTLLSRRHFPVIQSGDYLICDRAHGLQFMLFGCEEGIYLVDKKFTFYCLSQCSGFELLSTNKGDTTLLEGEMVRDKKSNRVVFYIADAVQINGDYCAHNTFTDRLNMILKLLDNNNIKRSPFDLNKKRFYTRQQFPDMLKDHIKNHNGWYYEDEKRYHRIQSIIFKPNESFPLLSYKKIFERKFQNSIFFSAKRVNPPSSAPPNGNQHPLYSLSVETEFGESEFRQVVFPKDDERLSQDIAQHKQTNLIIECVYEALHAQWRYIGTTVTKHKPNKARAVMETMIVMAEGVTIEELIFRIPRTSVEDNWMEKHVKSSW